MAEIVKFDERSTAIPSDIVCMLRCLKDELLEIDGIASVVLFGSYSKGTYGKNSDIDIAVFVREAESGKIHDIYRNAVRRAARYPYDIQILVFNSGSLMNPMGIVEEIAEYGQDITFI
jgi:predicted nucleotidyltransferase